MRTLLLVLQLATVQTPTSVPRAVSDSIRAHVDSVASVFLVEWRDAWKATQSRAPIIIGHDSMVRRAAVHCHWIVGPGRVRDAARLHALIQRFVITNDSAAQASCPYWYPAAAPKIADERRTLDGALAGEFRVHIHTRRMELRFLLEDAAQRLPNDVRLTGQRIRFALDAGAMRDAWIIAESCKHDVVQCALLGGLVLQRGGYVALADSAFLAAARTMSEGERCAWNDVGALLEPDMRATYETMDCGERAGLEKRLWWLADPLYHEPGNERRAEHFARKVYIDLLTHLPHDGRQHFTPQRGGKAVIETLLRYGWPSQMYWGGNDTDRGHSDWLGPVGSDTAPPYVAREYTRDRLRTLPPADILASPFTTPTEPWHINGPPGKFDWWPVEHIARDRSRIVELPAGQMAMLRRRDATRVLRAGNLDSALLARPRADRITAHLFVSRSPSDMQTVAMVAGRVGTPLIIDQLLAAGTALIAIEIPCDSTRPAARTRFGANIVEPLSALARGTHALSEPLLFEPTDDLPPTIHADDAVRRMYPTTTFQRRSRIGVYWEGYGFTATDTIDVELRVVREDQPGLLARAAGAVGLAQDPTASVAVVWRDEPGNARAIQVDEGGTPMQMRNVVVDVSRLARGSYRLTIAMKTGGRDAVTSERTFVLN